MIGRTQETNHLKRLLTKDRSSFVVVSGRRRIGKTYLIDQLYSDNYCLAITGIEDAEMPIQIRNFTQKLAEYSDIPIVTPPSNWQEVFLLTKEYLQRLPKRKKQVIFIDELPWMATARSGFIQLLAHLWNDYLSKHKHFILIVCGSATSWIDKRIIKDRGGFHNRVTDHIKLQPFTLTESEAFLQAKKIRLTKSNIAELYMTLGGVPYYLEMVERGESVAQTISRLCFDKGGALRQEYRNLYRAVFDNADDHEAVVATLATSRQGMTRKQLIEKSKVKAGGPITRVLNDLSQTGFITEQTPLFKKQRGTIYRLVDEYSIFYHRFIKPGSKKKWTTTQATQPYKIWLGYAFENLCLRHMDKIKASLGIAGIDATSGSYRYAGDDVQPDIQVDILIDRSDYAITLCECKYHTTPLALTSSDARHLQQRKHVLQQVTKTKKNLFTTLITNHAPIKNEHYLEAVDKVVLLEDLF
jgi:hypothetical protein